MIMKKIALLCLFWLIPMSFAYGASPVILENPPALYFSVPNKLSPPQIEKLILDAVVSSNMPEYAWSVVGKQPGLVSVKLVVRNKHYAYIDVHYNPAKIVISYKDSQNLKYEKIQGKYEIIHPNYMRWVGFLVTSLKNQTQLALGNVSLTDIPAISTKRSPGGHLMVVAAYGESSSLDSGNRLSSTNERLSNTLLQFLVKTVSRSKPDNVDILPIHDLKVTKDFLNESHDLPVSQTLCKQYKLLVLNSPVNLGGRGQRYVYLYLYVCDKGRKFKEKYTVNSGEYDAYSFQGDTKAALLDFIDYAKVYR